MHLVNVPGQADLMFCREQKGLNWKTSNSLASVPDGLRRGGLVPQSSPHARFDIQDWMPLDP